MKRDNSPVNPTCPEINNASSTIDTIANNLSEQIVELGALDKGLEKLRTENGDLRTWGNEQFDRAEELEKQLSIAEKEIKEVNMEIIEYINENKRLDEINMNLMKQAFADGTN